MIKKLMILLLTLSLFVINVSAAENEAADKPFTNILIQIYNNEADVDILSEDSDGTVNDCSREFVLDTYDYYLDNDFDSIFAYIAENNIMIVENNTDERGTASMRPVYDPMGIVTCTFRTGNIGTVTAVGTGVAGNNVYLPIIYRLTIRDDYDVATGKVVGTLRNPSVYIVSTDGNADDWSVTSVTCSKNKINDYEVRYSNIRFTFEAWNSYVPQTYAYTHIGQYTFAPANY